MDLSNKCTIKLKGTDTTFKGTLDNISANGFAFLTKDPYFVDNKGAKVTISIEDFALADHSVLDGYVIRCSNNDGTYIVGCQMIIIISRHMSMNSFVLTHKNKSYESL